MEPEVKLSDSLYKTRRVEVFKAFRGEEECVVKAFKVSSISEVNSIKREAEKMKGIDHEFIATVEECVMVGEGNSVSEVRLVMEYFPKGDLESLIESRTRECCFWSEEELYWHFRNLIDALAYLESQGLAHRDIKPANIFVDQDERLIIGDLGALKAISWDIHTIAGTPLYLSPLLRQQFMNYNMGMGNGNCQHDPVKSDVYSLGLTFLQMASFKGVSDLINLQNLDTNIWLRINELGYSNWTKSLLWDMLQLEEFRRPTFRQLFQKYFGVTPERSEYREEVREPEVQTSINEPREQTIIPNETTPDSNLKSCEECRRPIEDASFELECCKKLLHNDCLNYNIHSEDGDKHYYTCKSCGKDVFVFSENSFDCSNCKKPKDITELNVNDCGHLLCKDCLKKRISDTLGGKCIVCGYKLNEEIISKFRPSYLPDELFGKCSKCSREASMTLTDPTKYVFSCKRCENEVLFCVVCKLPLHEHFSCYLESKVRNSCIKCRFGSIKVGKIAKTHLDCKRCGIYCFVCGEKHNYDCFRNQECESYLFQLIK